MSENLRSVKKIFDSHCRQTTERQDMYRNRLHLEHCVRRCGIWRRIGNNSVPKITVNNAINLFLQTAISILVISGCCWIKKVSVYFIWKTYLYFSTGNGQPREPALCQFYQHTFIPYIARNRRSISKYTNGSNNQHNLKCLVYYT